MNEEIVRKFLENCTVELKNFIALYILFTDCIKSMRSVKLKTSGIPISGEELLLFNTVWLLLYGNGTEHFRKNIYNVPLNLERATDYKYDHLRKDCAKIVEQYSFDDIVALIINHKSVAFTFLMNVIDFTKEGYSLSDLRDCLVLKYKADYPCKCVLLQRLRFVESNNMFKALNDKDRISYEKFCANASDEVKQFVEGYLLYMYDFKDNYYNFYLSGQHKLSNEESIILILMALLSKYCSSILALMLRLDIDMDAYSYQNLDYEAQLQTIYKNESKKDIFNAYYIGSRLMSVFLNFSDGPIVLERIVANILKKFAFKYDHFVKNLKLDEFIPALEEQALVKEEAHNRATAIKSFDYTMGRIDLLDRLCMALLVERKSILLNGGDALSNRTLEMGLEKHIRDKTVHPFFQDHQFVYLESVFLHSGFENYVLKFLQSLGQGRTILCVNDIKEGDITHILKMLMCSKEIKFIGAPTEMAYQRMVQDSSFSSLFNTIEVDTLTEDQTLMVLHQAITEHELAKHIRFPLTNEEKNILIDMILQLYYSNISQTGLISSTDYVLRVLENAYASVAFHNKSALDVVSLIEGINLFGKVNMESIVDFQEKGQKLFRGKKEC